MIHREFSARQPPVALKSARKRANRLRPHIWRILLVGAMLLPGLAFRPVTTSSVATDAIASRSGAEGIDPASTTCVFPSMIPRCGKVSVNVTVRDSLNVPVPNCSTHVQVSVLSGGLDTGQQTVVAGLTDASGHVKLTFADGIRGSADVQLLVSADCVGPVCTSDTLAVEPCAVPDPAVYWSDMNLDVLAVSDLDGLDPATLIVEGPVQQQGMRVDLLNKKIYWVDYGLDVIQRANLDGTQVETLLSSGLISPQDIDIDLVAGKMYFVDNALDVLRRANLDGTGVETLVNGLPNVRGVAVDHVHSRVYWTETSGNKIERANTDGVITIETLVTGVEFPAGIALDVGSGKMYWVDSDYVKVQRANLDGSDIEDLLTSIDGLSIPSYLALDLEAGKIYFTDLGLKRILRADLDGGNLETIVDATEIGLSGPQGIAVGVNVPPFCAAGGPYSSDIGDAVQFTGATMFDQDGWVTSWQWDFGDGAVSTDLAPSHYYNRGFYTATLTVTDNLNKSSTATATVSVGPPALYLSASATSYQPVLEVEPMVPFTFYVVFAGAGATNIMGWEATVTNTMGGAFESLVPTSPVPGATNAGAGDNFVVGLGTCESSPSVVLTYRGVVAAPVSNEEFGLAPAAIPSLNPPAPGFVTCGASLVPFDRWANTRLFVNPTVSAIGDRMPRFEAKLSAWPSPFSEGDLNIAFALPESSAGGVKTRLVVYDVSGKRVRTIANRAFMAGAPQRLAWDGNDENGLQVPSGVYFLRLTGGAIQQTRKIVIVR